MSVDLLPAEFDYRAVAAVVVYHLIIAERCGYYRALEAVDGGEERRVVL